MKVHEIIDEGKKRTPRVKRRNFVHLHAQRSGAGEHKPKRGPRASRERQKREWKREVSESI